MYRLEAFRASSCDLFYSQLACPSPPPAMIRPKPRPPDIFEERFYENPQVCRSGFP